MGVALHTFDGEMEKRNNGKAGLQNAMKYLFVLYGMQYCEPCISIDKWLIVGNRQPRRLFLMAEKSYESG